MFDKNTILLDLKTIFGQDAKFRDGQFEAINAVVNLKQKVLVVQKTGWGKSIVYFLSAKYFKQTQNGITLIISPLLSLMRNQIENAQKLGLKVNTINSSNKDEWENVKKEILNNEIDALLIAPERLANEDFQINILEKIAENISLFVIDEAHCISDWGHDFRPDYKRITEIIKLIPNNTPILCTTATANNRVIDDIKNQIDGLKIIRGSLCRESLRLFTIDLSKQESRLAWLAQNLPKFSGSGIIYTLTVRDAKIVTEWLRLQNIDAYAYYGDLETQEREELENKLIKNELKVLVATSALGMGFDKSDITFVVHYQAPSSLITYYQQVGRAGRNIDKAFGILLSGHEDDDINEFFRKTALPKEEDINEILELLRKNDWMNKQEIAERLNLSIGTIDKILKFLYSEENTPILYADKKYHISTNKYTFNHKKAQDLLELRNKEWQDVKEYINTADCKMSFLQKELNDSNIKPCEKCQSCLKHKIKDVDLFLEKQALAFLKTSYINFSLKKKVNKSLVEFFGFKNTKIPEEYLTQNGLALSRYDDAGWGKIIKEDKIAGCFRNELVDVFIAMIKNSKLIDKIKWITCIPSSRNPKIVPNFAIDVANKLNLPFVDCIKINKIAEPQKNMLNSYHQALNVKDAFIVLDNIPNEPVLLIDDIINSGWTFTIVSILLRQKSCGEIYPVALSTTNRA